MKNFLIFAVGFVVAWLFIIGLATFTGWGFDPASWAPHNRFMFGALGMIFSVWLAYLPVILWGD